MEFDFKQDVLTASNNLPVVVDFWAPWCGPCRFLGPNLDKLAEENEGIWKLVKINVDDHQDISNQYGIRGIPAVKLFHKGEIIAEFTGALPVSAIQNWLDEHIPGETSEELGKMMEKEGQIPDQTLIASLKDFTTRHPENKEARLTMARHQVFVDPKEAVDQVEDIRMGEDLHDLADRVRQMASFLMLDLDDELLVENVLGKAKKYFQKGDMEQAILQIIEANKINKNFMDDLPRLTAIAFFEIMGREHELTKKYRRQFDMVLY